MKRFRQTYVLQDTRTKQQKMYKTMTVEESQEANAFLRSYESTSQWVQTIQAVAMPEIVSNERVA